MSTIYANELGMLVNDYLKNKILYIGTLEDHHRHLEIVRNRLGEEKNL